MPAGPAAATPPAAPERVPAPGSTALAGPGLMVLALLVLSTTDAMGKYLTSGYSVAQILMFRGLAGAALTLSVAAGHGLAVARPRSLGNQVLLGVCHVVTMTSFFVALRTLSLPDAVAIGFSSPIVTTLMAVLLLRERVTWQRWLAILAGFAGVLVLVRPGGALDPEGATWMCVAVLAYSLMQIQFRRVGRLDGAATTSLCTCLIGLVVGVAAAPFVWTTPSPFDLGMLLGIGITGAGGHMLIAAAMRRAPVAVLAPLDYSHVLFTGIWSWLFFRELPSATTWLGGPLIIAAGLYLVLSKRADLGRT